MERLSVAERLRRLRALGGPGPGRPPMRVPPPRDPAQGPTLIEVHHRDPAGPEARSARWRLGPPAGFPLLAIAPREGLRAMPGRVYLDTETTSLSGGAGARVFLVGLAREEGPGIRLRQHLLADPGDERSFLRAVVEDLATASEIVTFHGRPFDWPRLRDRCRWMGVPLPDLPHLDLLPIARRLAAGTLPDLRLATLEARWLGLRRIGDLGGAACPEAWFRYQRGDPALLDQVLRHNAQDLLSLRLLEAHLVLALEGRAAPPSLLPSATLLAEQGHLPAAEDLVRLAISHPDALLVPPRVPLAAARALLRAGSRGLEAELLEAAFGARPDPGLGWRWLRALERGGAEPLRLREACRVVAATPGPLAGRVERLRVRVGRRLGDPASQGAGPT
jgi:hypothetical protein